jgi:hypothetical protein
MEPLQQLEAVAGHVVPPLWRSAAPVKAIP